MKVFDLFNDKFIFDLSYKYICSKDNIIKEEYELDKSILVKNPHLIITDLNDNIIDKIDDVQPLYLYPLSVLDYCNNIKKMKMLSINIWEYSKDIDYLSFIINNDIKLVEFTISKDVDLELIENIKKNNVKIIINVTDLDLNAAIMKSMHYADYIRLFIPSQIDDFISLEKCLKLINNNKENKTLFTVKTYLHINMIDKYEKLINLLNKYNVDILQVSKELIPLYAENARVDIKDQEKIRYLENKYNKLGKTRFISVKNLSELYYPRFMLNDKNSRKCYASIMKPYMFKDILLPCKVVGKLNNKDYWNLGNSKTINYDRIKNKCGTECDDCASIFENDFLYKVEQIVKDRKVKYYIVCDK